MGFSSMARALRKRWRNSSTPGKAELLLLVTECFAGRDQVQVGGGREANRLLDVHAFDQQVPEVKALILGFVVRADEVLACGSMFTISVRQSRVAIASWLAWARAAP